jgi:ABC-type uncharacterized transport system substrate-binding protein
MMDRRRFLLGSLAGALAAPLAAEAQAGKVSRIGYLDHGSVARNKVYFDAFRQGLRDLGWLEGQNVVIEARFDEGKTDRLPALAAELVHLKVDVIATSSTPAALAAKRATKSIPIVIGFAADPVGSKIVDSLSRPAGNLTGWTHQGLELRAKWVELLKEAVPNATRFGVLWNPSNQVHGPSLKVAEAAARRLNVELDLAGVQDPKDLEPTLSALTRKRVEGLIVFPDGLLFAQKTEIIAYTVRHRLPAVYGEREYAAVGGLMTYGTNLEDMFRLGASLVDKILKGAKPGDLPVQQPTKFELVINLKTAKALGLTIPPSLLARADQVIE